MFLCSSSPIFGRRHYFLVGIFKQTADSWYKRYAPPGIYLHLYFANAANELFPKFIQLEQHDNCWTLNKQSQAGIKIVTGAHPCWWCYNFLYHDDWTG
jgi:hypothetical protein